MKATELIQQKFPNHNGIFVLKNIEEFMIEFAKMHVTAALKQASLEALVYADEGGCTGFIDENSVLDAYPLSNIT
jgi:hypothetical protein